jgi:hypothetical protein
MPPIVACVTDAVYLLHNAISFSFVFVSLVLGTRGDAIGWGTALPAGSQRVRLFIDIILPPHYDPEVDSASNRNGYQKYLLRGKWGRCVELKPYHLHVPTVLISGSLNLLESSGPVQGLLYLSTLLGLGNQTTCARMTSSLAFEVLSAKDFTAVLFLCSVICNHGWGFTVSALHRMEQTDLRNSHFKCRLSFMFSLYVSMCVKKINHLKLHTRDS